mmetsp:Transcript_2163/g.3518  ORF Transcript_2163/g.3518 Transcript_2163/m.3518 type:complete len:303 (-) Transcript_2163:724-1632(-)
MCCQDTLLLLERCSLLCQRSSLLLTKCLLCTCSTLRLRHHELSSHFYVAVGGCQRRVKGVEGAIGALVHGSHCRMIMQDLLVNERAYGCIVELVHLKLKLSLRHAAPTSQGGIRQALEVRVGQCLCSGGPVCGVEGHQALQQGQGSRRRIRKLERKGARGLLRKGGQEGTGLWVADALNCVLSGCPQQVCHELELANRIAPREQRLAQQHLTKDAANAPDINSLAVPAIEATTQLGGTVPAGGHIISPVDRGHVVFRQEGPCEPKVTDLQLAVGVGQDVLGLQVTVQHTRCMNEVESAQQLI